MESNPSHIDDKTSSGLRVIFGSGFLSMLLFFSGVFVWLTPLPILYAYKTGRRIQGLCTVFFALTALFVLYHVAIPFIASNWGEQKIFQFFFWVPGIVANFQQGLSPSLAFGIYYYAFFALTAILLGEFEPKALGATRFLLLALTWLMLAISLWVFLYSQGRFLELVHELETYFIGLMQELTKAPEGSEEVKTQMALLTPYFPRIAYYAVRLLPGMIVNSVIFVLWLNLVVGRKLFFKQALFPKLEPLSRWRFPFAGVWGVIAAAMLFLVDSYGVHLGWLKILALNVFLVFGFIYFLQGLAIAVYYVVRWSLSSMIRVALYLLLFLFFQPISLLLVIFGFFDSWFDFRKLSCS